MRSFTLFTHAHTAVGVELTDQRITLLRLDRKGGVHAYASVPLPHGVITDGAVLDKAAAVRALVGACAEAKPERVSVTSEVPVVFSLPESKVFVHRVRVASGLAKEAFSKAVEFEVRQTVPMDIEHLYWDFRVLRTMADKRQEVLVVSVPKEIIRDFTAVFVEAGLRPIAVDLESVALRRVVAETAHEGILVLDLSARTTNMGVFALDGSLRLSASVAVGREQLIGALSERLSVEAGEAEVLMQRDGFDRNITDNRVLVILQEQVQKIVLEAKKALQHVESVDGTKVERVVTTGEAGNIPFLNEYLGANLNVPVGQLADRVKVLAGGIPDTEPGHRLAVVVGLAQRGKLPRPRDADIDLLRGWEGERWAEHEASLRARVWWFALPLFLASVALLSYVVYAYLYLPNERLKEEAATRIVPTVIVDTGSATTTEEVSEVEDATSTPMVEASSSITQFESPDLLLLSLEASNTPKATTTKGSTPVVHEPALTAGTTTLHIGNTPTGWLRVRRGPGKHHPEITKVNTGEEYPVLQSQGDWTEIELNSTTTGWILTTYTDYRHL